MKDGTFVTIQSWMVKELNLSGNKLIIYGIINGFSQDGKSWFVGGVNYLEKFLDVKRRTIINYLEDMVSEKIIKEHKRQGKTTLYQVARPVHGIHTTHAGNAQLPMQEMHTTCAGNAHSNNKGNINKKDKENKYPDWEEFKSYGLKLKPKVDLEELKIKFTTWEDSGWVNGHGNKIKNWKNTLGNTIKYMNEKQQTEKKYGW